MCIKTSKNAIRLIFPCIEKNWTGRSLVSGLIKLHHMLHPNYSCFISSKLKKIAPITNSRKLLRPETWTDWLITFFLSYTVALKRGMIYENNDDINFFMSKHQPHRYSPSTARSNRQGTGMSSYRECCGISQDCHTGVSHQNTRLWKA